MRAQGVAPLKLQDINPVKVLLVDNKWYQVKPNTWQWVEVIYDEAEKEGYGIEPRMTVVYAKFKCADETMLIDSQSIVGYVIPNGS